MKTMHSLNDAVRELTHIAAMVSQLEQFAQRKAICRKETRVTLPDYWRARINDINPVAPDMQLRIRLLLARLDALEATKVGN